MADSVPAFHTETLVGLFTLAGVVFTGIVALLARREASQANKAVYHVEDGETPLMTMVKEIWVETVKNKSWRESYQGGPLDTGDKVRGFVEEVQQMSEDIRQLKRDVVKYGCPIVPTQESGCPRKQAKGQDGSVQDVNQTD